MRLLGLSNTYPPAGRGGYAEICADVMGGLAARGHEVTVLTCRPEEGLPGPREAAGVSVRPELDAVLADWRRPSRARAARRNDEAVLRHRLDAGVDAALVWHMRGVVKPPLRLVHATGVPVLYLLHDRWVLYERPGSVFVPWARAERAARLLLGEPPVARDGIVCFNSRWLRDEHRRLGWTPRHEHIVPCGLPPAVLDPAPAARDEAAYSRLMFAGRIDPAKGLHDAVEAIASLPEQVTLSVAGAVTRPGYAERVREHAAAVGVEGRMRWLGELSRPELVQAFADHDVLVYPSHEAESFGLGILEGQAAGLVAVTSAPGGPREFLEHEANCLLHEPGDAAALAAAVRRLCYEPGLAPRLRTAGRRTAESMPLAPVLDRVEELLRSHLRYR